MKSLVRPAELKDLTHIAANLRAEDAEEARALTGMSPEDAVAYSVFSSRDAHVCVLDGDEHPFALFGIASDATRARAGVPWLVTTDRVKVAPLTVVRRAKEWFSKWSPDYDYLHNFVDRRNHMHMRWLRMMGFDFGRPVMIRGTAFQYFFMHLNGVQPCVPPQLSLQSPPA